MRRAPLVSRRIRKIPTPPAWAVARKSTFSFQRPLPEYPKKLTRKLYGHPSLRRIIAKAFISNKSLRDKNEATTDDFIQDVLLLLPKRWKNYDPRKGTFGTWVYRVAADHSKDIVKSLSARSNIFNPAARIDENRIPGEKEFRNPSVLLEKKETSQILSRMLNQLSAEDRTILLLHVIHGLSKTEAAREIGISTEQFKHRYQRALERARAKLDSNPQWKKLFREDFVSEAA